MRDGGQTLTCEDFMVKLVKVVNRLFFVLNSTAVVFPESYGGNDISDIAAIALPPRTRVAMADPTGFPAHTLASERCNLAQVFPWSEDVKLRKRKR